TDTKTLLTQFHRCWLDPGMVADTKDTKDTKDSKDAKESKQDSKLPMLPMLPLVGRWYRTIFDKFQRSRLSAMSMLTFSSPLLPLWRGVELTVGFDLVGQPCEIQQTSAQQSAETKTKATKKDTKAAAKSSAPTPLSSRAARRLWEHVLWRSITDQPVATDTPA